MKKKYLGILFLVVGNSGSGKDSIISGALAKYPPNFKKAYLTKRFITRPPSEFEDNYSITTEEFDKMDNQGKFALTWKIYGLKYGVPIEIEDWLSKGHPVIVNVSREIIHIARERYENVRIVFIQVPFEITLERITSRGRETGKRLEERIVRARTHQKLPEADFVVDNSGDLTKAIDQFLRYLLTSINNEELRKRE